MSRNFEMKDLDDASFVIGTQIHQDRSQGILGLSQRSYVEKVLKRFGMHDCKSFDTLVTKGDKFSLNQCPKGNLKIQELQKTLYALVVGSLMYVKICTRQDIAYIVRVLGRYLSSLGMDHWKAAKKVMRYLQRTKEYMLTYMSLDQLEIIGYSNSYFVGCQDSLRSTSCYIFMSVSGVVSWCSAKQSITTSSTMATKLQHHVRHQIKEYG